VLLPAADLAAFERVTPPAANAIDILPKWDSYTMGYAPDGCARLVSLQMQSRVYTGADNVGGDGLGVVLVAGKAVAAWSSTFSGKRLDVTLDLFDREASPHVQALHARFEEVATVLGCATCSVSQLNPAEPSLVSSLGYNRVRSMAESE
jgi:Winged helix DNA-binding domain